MIRKVIKKKVNNKKSHYLRQGLLKNISVGIDLIEVNRFHNMQLDSKFAKNVFTNQELEDCLQKNNPAQSLASRFAAKEAIKKTLEENIKLNRIEIINELNGKPVVNFLDSKIKDKYFAKISITHTGSLAQAICFTVIR